MDSKFTASERQRLADVANMSAAYLYQCLTGRRDMGPIEAIRVEKATDGVIRRWDVCTKTWWQIWPDLIGAEGAPEVRVTA